MLSVAPAVFPPVRDAVVEVRVDRYVPADAEKDWCPYYSCGVYRLTDSERVGHVSVRLGDSDFLQKYAGLLGYVVDEPHRGHGYAARGVALIAPIARHHGLNPLWVTVNPENVASRKTLEKVGAVLVEVVDIPEGNDMYERGERRKCRYRWDL